MAVSGRTYLSIGDVLTLLRQEFPDVTISKIRFLESQGLVNPERTPSGYRKFYDHDVERLRWVLRQQREHFLPLKVIKGRLEQEVSDPGEGNGHDTPDEGESSAPQRHEPVLVGRSGAQRTGADRPGRPISTPDPTPGPGQRIGTGSPVMAGRAADAMTRSRGGSGSPGSSLVSGTSPGGGQGHRTGSGARTGAGTSPVATSGAGPGAPRGAARSTAGVKANTGSATGPGPTPARGSASRRADPGSEATDEARPSMRPLSGTSFTVQELAEGCGLDVPAVEQLESYGLLCGRVVGGVAYYDEDALAVSRLAAGLARYGVEARHLRLHKHAAEREAGFIEQIVLPLLKQRNPEAHQRAHDAVTELSQLGQGLREVLLRSTLRDQLGG
jgi:DNA-binding transcriptional MerR regulator